MVDPVGSKGWNSFVTGSVRITHCHTVQSEVRLDIYTRKCVDRYIIIP